MTTDIIVPTVAEILALAQASMENLDDEAKTLALEEELVAMLNQVLVNGSKEIINEAINAGTPAANVVKELAWIYADTLEWSSPDIPLEQQLFVIPMLVAADTPVVGHIKHAADPSMLNTVAASLRKAGMVHKEASISLVPYLYQTAEFDAMGPFEIFQINRAAWMHFRASLEDGGATFNDQDPVWHFNTAPAPTIEGATLQLRYMVGTVIDMAGRAGDVVTDPKEEAAAARRTTKIHKWSRSIMGPIVTMLGAQEVFVMAPSRASLAVEEGLTMLNVINFATTLDFHLDKHGLGTGDVEVDVQYTFDELPKPGEKPDQKNVMSMLLDVYDKEDDSLIFQMTWPRPGDRPYWIDEAYQELKSSGVDLRDPNKPSAPRPGTISPMDGFDEVDPAKAAFVFPSPKGLH